ncbi:MAG: HAD hydrolase family protein [Burkholderiales bacterium]|nr:HAD hydrolase family protein [Burkholderiales bacterium]
MQAVRGLVCDVDGVLTDGKLNYLGDQELKSFSVLDGFGITLAKQAGWRVALLTARGGPAVERRAAELGVELVSGERNKGVAFRALCDRWQLPAANVAYIGDDWLDLPAMLQAGLAATVPASAAAVRQRAHWLATAEGGNGAVREFVEAVLRLQGRLDALLQRYLNGDGETRAGADEADKAGAP